MTAGQTSVLLHAAKYNGILPADIHLSWTETSHNPVSVISQLGKMGVGSLWNSCTLHQTASIPCTSHWPAVLP